VRLNRVRSPQQSCHHNHRLFTLVIVCGITGLLDVELAVEGGSRVFRTSVDSGGSCGGRCAGLGSSFKDPIVDNQSLGLRLGIVRGGRAFLPRPLTAPVDQLTLRAHARKSAGIP